MEIKAVQKYVRMSPRKLRLVVPLVKDLSPIQAVEVLPHIGKRAAQPLKKVILSAISNAKEKSLSENDLIFKEIQINEGSRLKRGRAGARGMYKPYKRKMSHIRVVLTTRKLKTQNPKPQPENVTHNALQADDTNSNVKNSKSKTKSERKFKSPKSRKNSRKTK